MKDFCIKSEKYRDLIPLLEWCREMRIENTESYNFTATGYFYGIKNNLADFSSQPFGIVYNSFHEFLYSTNLENILE